MEDGEVEEGRVEGVGRGGGRVERERRVRVERERREEELKDGKGGRARNRHDST